MGKPSSKDHLTRLFNSLRTTQLTDNIKLNIEDIGLDQALVILRIVMPQVAQTQAIIFARVVQLATVCRLVLVIIAQVDRRVAHPSVIPTEKDHSVAAQLRCPGDSGSRWHLAGSARG